MLHLWNTVINDEPLHSPCDTHNQEVVLHTLLVGSCWLGVVQAPHAVHEKLVLVGPGRKVDINLKEAGSSDLTEV